MPPDTKLVQFYKGPHYVDLPTDPTVWLVRYVVPSGGDVNLYGAPKTAKSYAALQLASRVSHEAPDWLGFEILRHGPVAYLQVDTPRGEWIERIKKLQSVGYNFDNVWFSDKLALPYYPINAMESAHMDALREGLKVCKPVMVIIDTLREVHAGDEDSATVMRGVLANIRAAVGHNVAIVYVSHAKKEQPDKQFDDIINDGRGSSYLPGKMDVIMKLTKRRLLIDGRSVPKDLIVRCHQEGTPESPPYGELVLTNSEEDDKVLAQALKKPDKERVEWLSKKLKLNPEAARSRLRRFQEKSSQLS